MQEFITVLLVVAFIGFVVYKTVIAKKLGGNKLVDKPKDPTDQPRK